MMKRVVIGVIVVSFAAATPASAGDLRESIARAARSAAEQRPKPAGGFPNEKLLWTGITLITIGSIVAVVAATSGADETVICSGAGNSVGCTDTKSVNKGALWAGIGTAGVGSGLILAGARSHAPEITIQRGRFAVGRRIRF